MSSLHRCQTCKQDATQTEFGGLKGGLRPQCKRCYNLAKRNRYYLKKNPIARRTTRLSYFSINLKAFEDVSDGGYELIHKTSGKVAGLLGLKDGVVYLQLRLKRLLIEENHILIADYLSTQGFLISSKRAHLPLDAFDGTPKPLEEYLTPKQSDFAIKLWARMRAAEISAS